MKCQFCNCTESRVVDSRPTDDGNSIRRRRECIGCGRRFTTYEKIEAQQLLVIKKDHSRELFDPKKLRSGIIAACHKRQRAQLPQRLHEYRRLSLPIVLTAAPLKFCQFRAGKTVDKKSYNICA